MKIRHNKFLSFNSIIFLSVFVGLNTLLNSFLVQVKADSSHQHGMNMSSENGHAHKTLDVSNLNENPSIEIEIFPDKIKGWNLYLNTKNFEFISPNLENNNPNQGHAHLYINGVKVSRIYSNWYYISELPEKDNEIEVTLNTNNHHDLIYNGKVVGDRILITNKK